MTIARWTCIYSGPPVYPEVVVKYPNLSAVTFNTMRLTWDHGKSPLAQPERSGSSLALLAGEITHWACPSGKVEI